MNLTLKKLILQNFKGIKSLEINLNPSSTDIMGDNGTFKSSIFDGYTWLLFGKDQYGRTDTGKGRFEVKPLDGNNEPIHKLDSCVEGIFDLDGQDLSLKRIFREKWVKKRGAEVSELTGHETEFYYNEVPLKKGEYEDKIADIIHEDTFKMLSDPYKFCTLPWLTQREILINMVGGLPDDSELMNTNDKFHSLIEKLSNKSLKDYQAQVKQTIKKLKEDKDKIPVRIDEVNNNMPEVLNYPEIEAQIEDVDKKIKSVDEQLSGIASKHQQHFEQKSAIEKELYDIKGKMQSIERDASRQISEKLQVKEDSIKEVERDIKKIQDDMKDWSDNVETNNNRIKSFNARKEEIQDSWKKEPKTISFDDKNAACPTCHRPFDEAYLEEKKEETIKEFNTRLQEKMQTMTEEGQSLNKKIKGLEAENENLEADIEQGHGILASKRTELENIKQSPTGVQTTQGILKDNAEYQHLKEALVKIEERLNNVASGELEGDSELKTSKRELQAERDNLIAQLNTKSDIERANVRIKELESEEQEINDKISAYEKDEFLIEEFVKLKVDTYEKPINELFENVKFKLFDVQMNGGISETCEAMVNGVPWALANTAAKVQTGIEIINRLADYNNMYTPFFIDGRESVVEIPETKSQVINLIVKEGVKPLKIQ